MENRCDRRLKPGDRVKKLSGNLWKYRSDHHFLTDSARLMASGVKLVGRKNEDMQSLMSATRRKKGLLSSD